MEEDGSSVKLAKVDATEEKALGEKFGVRGYPTLKFFRSGNPVDYQGPRDAEGIVQWLEKKTGPPALDVNDVETLKELKENNKVVIVGFFTDKDSEGAKEFLKAAGAIDDHKVLITSNADVIKAQDATDNSIVLYKSFDEPKVTFEGSLVAKVSSNPFPLKEIVRGGKISNC